MRRQMQSSRQQSATSLLGNNLLLQIPSVLFRTLSSPHQELFHNTPIKTQKKLQRKLNEVLIFFF